MGLRNILLFISIIIIGFCLSLYFQTGQGVKSLKIEEYKSLEYIKEQSHSLEDFNHKITPYVLQNVIREIVEKNRLAGEKTRVMELGTGNGRVLMELRKIFPDIELYGINKEKTYTFYRRESYLLSALKFDIFKKQELEKLELPYIIFQDLDFGARIPYDDERFDVIFSQGTLPHIEYKFELLNEVLRVLKTGGISFHSDLSGINIYSKSVILDLRDALAEIRRKGLDTNTLETQTSIRIRKNGPGALFPLIPHRPVPIRPTTQDNNRGYPEMNYNIVY
jgi:SAM-dependent methyltransferase